MQSHSSNRSPNVITLPSGNEIDRNDLQDPSVNSGNGVVSGTTPNINRAPSSEIAHSLFCPAISTLTSEMMGDFGFVCTMTAGERCASVPLKVFNCNCAAIFRHVSRTQKATLVEISFIHLTYLVGKENAEKLAEKIGWKPPSFLLSERDWFLSSLAELFAQLARLLAREREEWERQMLGQTSLDTPPPASDQSPLTHSGVQHTPREV